MESIRSRQNVQLKNLRRSLLRSSRKDGLIALEGEHLVQEALRSRLALHTVFVREDRVDRFSEAIHAATVAVTVSPDAFNHACATESPQGIAALVEAPRWSLETILDADMPRVIVLAGLQDPGNVGTILRTAEALGSTGVLLIAGSCDPWSQKALRSSAGSIFRLPAVSLENTDPLRLLTKRNIPLYAATAGSGAAADTADLRTAWSVVIGNEGAGIPRDVLELCTGAVHIPCPGPVESLNAAIAAAILLYEASRQRTRASIAGRP